MRVLYPVAESTVVWRPEIIITTPMNAAITWIPPPRVSLSPSMHTASIAVKTGDMLTKIDTFTIGSTLVHTTQIKISYTVPKKLVM